MIIFFFENRNYFIELATSYRVDDHLLVVHFYTQFKLFFTRINHIKALVHLEQALLDARVDTGGDGTLRLPRRGARHHRHRHQ